MLILKNIIKQWRAHFLGMTLLSLGFMIGILFVSIGVSIIEEARANATDSFSGNPEYYRIVTLSNLDSSPISYEQLLPILIKTVNDAEIQMLNLQGNQIEETSINLTIVPTMYSEQPEWQVPLLEGRYFTPEESMSKEKLILIGKGIAGQLFPNGINAESIIHLEKEEYKVVGTIGRKNRDTQWDYVTYTPFQALPGNIKNFTETASIQLRSNNNEPTRVVENFINAIEDVYPNSSSSIESFSLEHDQGPVWNSLAGTIFVSGLILLIAIINVMNLSLFWILDRHKEIAIRKAFGATDYAIIRLVVFELIAISLTSSIAALALQKLFVMMFTDLAFNIEISWLNFVIGGAVAVICGVISSITPVREILKMTPVEALRND